MTAHLFDTHAVGVNANPSAFLEAALEASTEYAILATANDGSIGLWNEGARRLYGYEASEMFGRPLSACTPRPIAHDRERIAAAGFDGYISKPIDPLTFLEQLRPFLPDSAADGASQTQR